MSNIEATPALAISPFVEDFAALQAPWGMPPAIGRLYGFLLLSPAPVSLDEMVTALDVAKSSASVMARSLEQAGVVRRYGEPGTKRVRYAAAEDAAGLFAAKTTLLGEVVRMLEAEAASSSFTPAVRDRLSRHARFYTRMRASIETMLRDADAAA